MKTRFNYLFLSLLTFAILYSCSGDDDNNSENELPLNSSKQITKFVFNATTNETLDANITATVNENDKTIIAEVPYGTNITALVPTIEISPKATVSPEGAQDFSTEIIYTVTAEDDSKVDYTVTVTVIPNTEAKIISFAFLAENNAAIGEDVIAIIDEDAKTVTAYVAYGTDITELTASTEISPDASLTPEGAQDFSSEVVYTVTAGDESTKVDYSVNVIESSNSDAKILIFTFLAENNTALKEDVTAVIDEEAKIVTAEVPYGTDITALIPTVNVSPDATFTPEGAQDFSSEVVYAITAGDESTQVDYTINVNITANTEAKILSFTFLAENNTALEENITAFIDEDTKNIIAEVPYGTDITGLNPTLVVSPDAGFSPQEDAQDFSSDVVYTITAGDESTKTEYTVKVSIIKNSEAKVLSFAFLAENNSALEEDVIATIDEDTKTINALLPYGTDATSLVPFIQISEDASMNAVGSVDFSSEVILTVTAQDGSVVTYSVIVNIEKKPQHKALIAIHDANPGNTLGWDLENPDIGSWAGVTTDVNGNVIRLYIWRKNLTTLPSEIGQLIHLNHLTLIGNHLTTLPAEIGQLVNLTELNLVRNSLTTIPAEIGQLVNLTTFNLDGNELTNLPAEMGQLVNLTELILDSNKLTNLPAEIGQLINLTTLKSDYNKLTTLPAEMGQLTNLTGLDISANNFTIFPLEIGQLTNLIDLNIGRNKLTTIPDEIGQLTNLKKLFIEFNKLTTVSPEIGRLVNLTSLSLLRNDLETIPAEIGQLVNLTYLNISMNDLTSIPQEVCNLETNGTGIELDEGVTCE